MVSPAGSAVRGHLALVAACCARACGPLCRLKPAFQAVGAIWGWWRCVVRGPAARGAGLKTGGPGPLPQASPDRYSPGVAPARRLNHLVNEAWEANPQRKAISASESWPSAIQDRAFSSRRLVR